MRLLVSAFPTSIISISKPLLLPYFIQLTLALLFSAFLVLSLQRELSEALHSIQAP